MATPSKIIKLASKRQKTTLENGNAENFNKIEIFDFEDKLIDEDTINLGNLISTKCCIRYWRHFAFKTLELVALKLLNQANTIKDITKFINLSYK